MKNVSEAKTRQDIIDKRLLKSGWNVEDPSQVTSELNIWVGLPEGVAEPEHEHQGFQYADYALLGEDGYPLAVVEAKKTSKDARVGQEQARQYAVNIQKNSGKEMPLKVYGHLPINKGIIATIWKGEHRDVEYKTSSWYCWITKRREVDVV